MTQKTTDHLLLKGLEEEVYTCTRDGEAVGLAPVIAAELNGFDQEPDARNVEYITIPHRNYQRLTDDIMKRRATLRCWLQRRDDLTLMPGGTLALGDTSQFVRSKPGHPYHDWIESHYGTRVVTASNHLNVGIDQPENLIRIWRLIRAEASLFLAFTAASPFIDGRITGYHSWRWHDFPNNPDHVPFFADYAAYYAFVQQQIEAGVMHNIRHLWLSARPNGNGAPENLDRLELRVTDRMHQLELLIGITAALETRIHQALDNPDLDPLQRFDSDTLVARTDANEEAVAKASLEAEAWRWDRDAVTPVLTWARDWLDGLMPTAEQLGIDSYLRPLHPILDHGNTAMRWLQQSATESVPQIIQAAIAEDTENFLAYQRAANVP